MIKLDGLEKFIKNYSNEKNKIKVEIDAFIEVAVNYEDLLEISKDKEFIDREDLVFNDTKDKRYYENLNDLFVVYEKLIECFEILNKIDDKKEIHRQEKNIEELISEIRSLKKTSRRIIEQENELITNLDNVIDSVNRIIK